MRTTSFSRQPCRQHLASIAISVGVLFASAVAFGETGTNEVTLTQPVQFPVLVNGKEVGSASVPAGTTLKVIEVHGDTLKVERDGVTKVIPTASTDYQARIEKADAAKKQTPSKVDETAATGKRAKSPAGPKPKAASVGRKTQEDLAEDQLAEQNKNRPANSIPFLGDEMPVTSVISEAEKLRHTPVIICGALRGTHYYYYGYGGKAEATHNSFRFEQVTADAKPIPENVLMVYADKRSFAPLMGLVAGTQEGGRGTLFRLKVVITSRSFQNGQFKEMVELVDWQRLRGDRNAWTDWRVHPAGK